MADKRPTIGMDLGGTNIQCGLVDAKGKILARDDTKTKADRGGDAVVERMIELIDDVLDKAKLKLDDVAAIGVGAAGAVDVNTGIVVVAPNLRWNNFPLREKLRKKLDCPVIVDNDVNVGAWGEYVAGAAKDQGDMLSIFVGTGIGGGLVLDGRLYHGHFQIAGEIGHTTIAADAGLGRRTLEQRSSRTAVANRLRRLIQTNHPSALVEITDGDLDKIRSRAIAEAIDQGDLLTIAVLEETARDIGIAAANAASLLALSCVVLGGGLTEALRDWWVDRVQEAFNKYVFPHEFRACKILMSELHDDAGVVGAGLLARHE